jgi:hypothetical protein
VTDRELRLRLRIDQLTDKLVATEEALEECRSGRRYWWNRASQLTKQLDLRKAREQR